MPTDDTSRPTRNIGEIEVNLSPTIVFPESLRQKPVPTICFLARASQAGTTSYIYLPMPPGVTFGDNMSYSTLDLGIIGTIANETINQISSQNTISGAIGAGVGGLVGSVVNKAKKLNAAAAASIIARNIPSAGNIADVIDFSTKQVIAPNTNTSFQNSGIRQFNFTFKLVSRTKKEAVTIDRMINRFRNGMYPQGDDVVLAYPATWKIDFVMPDGTQNKFIPKIYSCYLTSLNTTFNGSTNLFHEDGSPVETDVSISFQETKALTRGNIVKLQEERDKG